MPTSRATLKEYFQKGKRPTELQFAEFIDSMLNLEDDGVFPRAGRPLSINAVGDEQDVLNFYRVEGDQQQLAWQFKQQPGAKLGLSIHDATASRLFIESGTGNVGIATTEPKAKFHITAGTAAKKDQAHSGFVIIGDAAGQHLALDNRAIVAKDTATTAGTLNLQHDGGDTVIGGKVTIRESGNLVFSNKTRQMLNLWGTEYGIGIQASTQYFRTYEHFAWYRRGTHHDNALNAGAGGVVQMVITSAGNVGIGTAAPGARLDVEGLTRLGKGTAESWFPYSNGWVYLSGKGIIFREDTAGGSTERMRIADNGNVGIGTAAPAEKLHVQGNVFAQGNVNFGQQRRQMVNLWGTEYGVGIQSGTQYCRTAGHFAWYHGGTHHDGELNAGEGGAVQMVIKFGNVGIGTAALTKLHIEGGSDASPTGHGYLMLGPVDGNNLVIDDNEIMARSNGAPSTLVFNADGGGVSFGGGPALKKILAGRVGRTGNIVAGTGFTSERTGEGVYELTFTPPFSSEPVVVATRAGDGDDTVSVSITMRKITVYVYDVDPDKNSRRQDGAFCFVAVEV